MKLFNLMVIVIGAMLIYTPVALMESYITIDEINFPDKNFRSYVTNYLIP